MISGHVMQKAVRGQAPTPVSAADFYRNAFYPYTRFSDSPSAHLPVGGHVGPSELPWPEALR